MTSGTTGKPKVIFRNHKSWTSAFKEQSKLFDLCENDTLYLFGKFSYIANLNAYLHMLSIAGTAIIADSNRPKSWLKDITYYILQYNGHFYSSSKYASIIKSN